MHDNVVHISRSCVPNSCLYADVAIGRKFGADMIKAMGGLSRMGRQMPWLGWVPKWNELTNFRRSKASSHLCKYTYMPRL
jgi:hypothetical protein